MPLQTLWHFGEWIGLEYALIESTSRGRDVTRSSMLVENKEMRTIRYTAVLWGVMS